MASNKQMIPLGNHSLIKYSTPFLVSVSQPLKSLQDPKKQTTEELLNEIIKPKEYLLDNHQLWKQTVLSTPATKTEVINLEEELDKRLVQRNAKQEGLCPQRQVLYDECFDELIRQITIDCKQRGLLLVKVRDELKAQMDSFQKLYESSIGFGMRKVVEKESYKNEIKQDISTHKKEQEELDEKIKELKQSIHNYRNSQESLLERKDREHQETIEKLKQKNKALKDEMDRLLGRS